MEVRMKIYHWLLPALSLFPASAAAQMAGYEYWTDGNDTQRTYVEQTQGSVELQYMILWKSNKGQNEKKS